MRFKEEWLLPGAVVPVDAETTRLLVEEIKRVVGVAGQLALEKHQEEEVLGHNGWGFPIEPPCKTGSQCTSKCQICSDKLFVGEGIKDDPIRACPVCYFKERLAKSIEQMPFGDTATSFAVYVRNFK